MLFSIYDYIRSPKNVFGSTLAAVECLIMIILIVYFFFERMKYYTIIPLYQKTSFWILVGLILYFAGNFFLLLYARTMINNSAFRYQYDIIYSTFNILKNMFICIAILINEPVENNQNLFPPNSSLPINPFKNKI